MLTIMTSKRKQELLKAERDLYYLKMQIADLKVWCAYDSPEIGYAMVRLQNKEPFQECISTFRDELRRGKYTFDNYKNT